MGNWAVGRTDEIYGLGDYDHPQDGDQGWCVWDVRSDDAPLAEGLYRSSAEMIAEGLNLRDAALADDESDHKRQLRAVVKLPSRAAVADAIGQGVDWSSARQKDEPADAVQVEGVLSLMVDGVLAALPGWINGATDAMPTEY